MTVIRVELFRQALELIVDFIWRRINCDHVRVELNHIKDKDGKLAADPFIKKVFSESGFRWKTLQNDPKTGKRAQIMQLNKPTTGEKFEALPKFENPRKLKLGAEPITIKSAILIGLGSSLIRSPTKTLRQSTRSLENKEHAIEAPVSILSCLQKFKELNTEEES